MLSIGRLVIMIRDASSCKKILLIKKAGNSFRIRGDTADTAYLQKAYFMLDCGRMI